MLRIFNRVRLAYLGAFLLVCGGLWAYEALFVWPAQQCEANGAWWNHRDHECDTPVQVWKITGRAPHSVSAPSTPAAPVPTKP